MDMVLIASGRIVTGVERREGLDMNEKGVWLDLLQEPGATKFLPDFLKWLNTGTHPLVRAAALAGCRRVMSGTSWPREQC